MNPRLEPSVKITQEEVIERQTVLLIELDDEDLGPYLDRGYSRVVQQINIPGFRKGKAPRPIVERFVGRESLLQESLEYMLPDVTQRAVEAQKLETAGVPKLELEDLDPVIVKATVALTPEVDLGDYQAIQVEEPVVEVTDESIEQRLEELRREASSWVPVERSVELGDMVSMSVQGSVEGKQFMDQPDAVHVAEEGSVVPLPGFSAKLVGSETGKPTEFDLPVPDDYPDATLAGKESRFSITVNEVKERQLPDLDDEFAKGVRDGFDSLQALRDDIQHTVEEEAENARVTQLREASIEALVNQATVELAPLLVDHEIEHMVERRNQFVDSLNMQMSDYLKITGKTEQETQDEMRGSAVERLSRSWALSKLAELEKLEVTQEEIDGRIQELADSSEDPSRFLKNKNLNSDEVTESLRNSILMEKAVDHLTDLAKKGPETAKATEGRAEKETEQPEEGDGDVQKQT